MKLRSCLPLFLLPFLLQDYGRWKLMESKDAMTDKSVSGAILASDDGGYNLAFFKRDGKPSIGFQVSGRGIIESGQRPVIRLDDADAFESSWIRMDNAKVAIFSERAGLIDKLREAKAFKVRFVEYPGRAVTVSFDVTHFTNVLEAVK